jgi:hypothetical protein
MFVAQWEIAMEGYEESFGSCCDPYTHYDRMVHNLLSSSKLLVLLEKVLPGRELLGFAPLSDGKSYRVVLSGEKVVGSGLAEEEYNKLSAVFVSSFISAGFVEVSEIEFQRGSVIFTVVLPEGALPGGLVESDVDLPE